MNEEAATEPGCGAARVDKATFQNACGTTFRVIRDDEQIPLLLTEFVDGPTHGNIESFSLFFHGPADCLLEQGTYALDHDTLGSLTMFIVPILGSNAERIVYQASFARSAQCAPAR